MRIMKQSVENGDGLTVHTIRKLADNVNKDDVRVESLRLQRPRTMQAQMRKHKNNNNESYKMQMLCGSHKFPIDIIKSKKKIKKMYFSKCFESTSNHKTLGKASNYSIFHKSKAKRMMLMFNVEDGCQNNKSQDRIRSSSNLLHQVLGNHSPFFEELRDFSQHLHTYRTRSSKVIRLEILILTEIKINCR